MVYELVRYKYRSIKTSLLSAFGFAFTYYFIMFHSQFLYKSFAFPLFLTTIYAVERSKEKGGIIWRVIAILTTLLLVFTHHLTSFMLIIFIALNTLISWILNLSIKNRKSNEQQNMSFIVFSMVIILSYWIYLKYTPIQIGIILLEDAFRDSSQITQYPINFLPTLDLKLFYYSKQSLRLVSDG